MASCLRVERPFCKSLFTHYVRTLCLIETQGLNSLLPEQNWEDIAHDNSKTLFLNGNVCIWGRLAIEKIFWGVSFQKNVFRQLHDDVIKRKHFPRYWPFVREIHRSPVNSPPKGQWRGALMFSLICSLKNGWVNIREAGDLRRHHAHYDVILVAYISVEYTTSHHLNKCWPSSILWLWWCIILRSTTRISHLH